MRKSNLFQPMIVMIHICFSHVHFAYWKIEAFWANEPFRSLLQVTAEFNPSYWLLTWLMEISLEAFPFSLKLPKGRTLEYEGPRDQNSCSALRELKGNPRGWAPPPTPFLSLWSLFSWELRRAKKKGGSEDQERQSGVGAGDFPCIYHGLELQLALKTKQKNNPPKTSFLSFLLPFFQAHRRLEQLIWVHKHQTRSSHGNSKLPPQRCTQSPGSLFKASVRFLRNHPQNSLRIQPSPHPNMLSWKDMVGGGETVLAEKLVMGSVERLWKQWELPLQQIWTRKNLPGGGISSVQTGKCQGVRKN